MPTHLWYEEYQSKFIDEWYTEKPVLSQFLAMCTKGKLQVYLEFI